jgi:hypothetical protein
MIKVKRKLETEEDLLSLSNIPETYSSPQNNGEKLDVLPQRSGITQEYSLLEPPIIIILKVLSSATIKLKNNIHAY